MAFSCKAGICPSCNARRMEDTAEHLVTNVFPRVPVRQWVLTLPRRVRFLAARQPEVASRLLDVFTRTVFAWLRRRARALGVADPRTGGVTAVQRFGGALNLNVHFHTLVPDGVFDLSGEGRAVFVPLAPPAELEVQAMLERIVRRCAKVLVETDEAEGEEDALAALQAAEVERRLRYPERFAQARRSAYADGFSLHAGVRIHANDRDGLERLCRYVARPPFALDRLTDGEEGRLLYRMKRPPGGSLWLSLAPEELVARLATLVPPPRVHATRYHGVFAPNARGRARVVPERLVSPAPATASTPAPEPTGPAPSPGKEPPPRPKAEGLRPSPETGRRLHRVPWAELLRKVFAVDVLECPECQGRLRVTAYIAEEAVARRILEHLGLDATGPPVRKAVSAEELPEPPPEHDGVDPVYEE